MKNTVPRVCATTRVKLKQANTTISSAERSTCLLMARRIIKIHRTLGLELNHRFCSGTDLYELKLRRLYHGRRLSQVLHDVRNESKAAERSPLISIVLSCYLQLDRPAHAVANPPALRFRPACRSAKHTDSQPSYSSRYTALQSEVYVGAGIYLCSDGCNG